MDNMFSNLNNYPIPKLNIFEIGRFWSFVNKTDGCWLWTGKFNHEDYGRFSINGIGYMAHRLAYYLSTNIDPVGQLVLHKCDSPPCCNPEHLFLGTNQDNIKDCMRKGRYIGFIAGKSNCKLTEKEVLEIRDRYSKGETQNKLAEDFNIRQGMISKIVRKLIWKHI